MRLVALCTKGVCPDFLPDIFQTDHRNPHLSKTSSYLDLSILYGDVQEEQNLIRTFQDGKLKPDTFSEKRLQALPAACGVLLVMLNRCVSSADSTSFKSHLLIPRHQVSQLCC